MTRTRLIIIIAAIVIFFAALGIYFTIGNSNEPQAETTTQTNDFDFVKEDETKSATPEYFESFGTNKLRITEYGGYSDIKTQQQGGIEYALIRNPTNTGGLDFAASNEFGEFYFAEDVGGDKIPYPDGTPEGRFGYLDFGEVSKVAISDRNPATEYYASYPSQELAKRSGFISIRDDGTANLFLNTRYLKITNLNNNRQVIVEIDSRNNIPDTLFVSEATRRALGIDNKSLGAFNLELVDKQNNTLGVVRL